MQEASGPSIDESGWFAPTLSDDPRTGHDLHSSSAVSVVSHELIHMSGCANAHQARHTLGSGSKNNDIGMCVRLSFGISKRSDRRINVGNSSLSIASERWIIRASPDGLQ